MSRAARRLGFWRRPSCFLSARGTPPRSVSSRLGLLGEHLRDHRARLGAREGHRVAAAARRVDDEEWHAADALPRPALRFRLHLPRKLLRVDQRSRGGAIQATRVRARDELGALRQVLAVLEVRLEERLDQAVLLLRRRRLAPLDEPVGVRGANDAPLLVEGDPDLTRRLVERVVGPVELRDDPWSVLGPEVLHEILALSWRVVIQEERLPVDLQRNLGGQSSRLQVTLADVAPRSYGVRDERDAEGSGSQGGHLRDFRGSAVRDLSFARARLEPPCLLHARARAELARG